MSERFLARLDRVVSSTDPLARDRIQHKIESLLQAGGTSYRRLVALIQDSHQPPDIRAAACWLVGYLGYRRALPSLLQALTDNSAEVQVEATRAVGKLHEVSAVPRLTTLLASDSDNQVREAAAYALGQIRSEGAIEPLVAILVDPHEQPDLRSRAAESLGDLALNRVKAVTTALPVLLSALGDSDVWVRHDTAVALGYLRDRRAVAPLMKLLETDADPRVQEGAAVALGWIRSKQSVGALSKRVEDPNSPFEVREAAVDALRSFQEQESSTDTADRAQ